MTQEQTSRRLRACLHFQLHPALSPSEKLQLARHIKTPEDGLGPRAPAALESQSAARWTEWISPLGRIEAAAELIETWLAEHAAGDAVCGSFHPRSSTLRSTASSTAPSAPRAHSPTRQWISFWDAHYPAALRSLARPPWVLLLEGHVPAFSNPMLAIVGSRNATRAGLRRARDFAREMAGQGWTIVSGMAKGIDAAAHAGALDAGGQTIAVLGCGINQVYPPENRLLRESIVASGGLIVSEYPPGTPPNAHFFPARNRIIAGLSRGVLVVEAAVRSGSLITAHLANEIGRAVMAIPGSIDSPQARGCHQMIREGARLVETVTDILEEIGGSLVQANQRQPSLPGLETKRPHRKRLPAAWGSLLSQFGGSPAQFDDLSTTCKLPAAELSALLLQLELAGLVECQPGQWWAPT